MWVHVLPAHFFECAAKKNALRSIEHGNDVQALGNIDVEAESLCSVSIVPGEDLTIQTQTAVAREVIKKQSMDNCMTNNSDQVMLVRELGKIVKASVSSSITRFTSSCVGACRARRRGCFFQF